MAKLQLADLLGVRWNPDSISLESRGGTLRIVDGPGRADLVRSMAGGFDKNSLVKVAFSYHGQSSRKQTIQAKVSQVSAFESYPCIALAVQIKGWILHPKNGNRVGTFKGYYDPQMRTGSFECKLKE